jgi:ferritin-like metal-binding protein YciE
MKSLKDLLIEQINELHASEMHSEPVLAKLAAAAASPKLAEAIRGHIDETKQHLARLDRVFGELGIKPRKPDAQKAETHGSKGLLEDCTSIAGRTRIEAHVRDAAIIASLQRLEHDEIAGYGCARTWARLLGHQAVARTLQDILDEERDFDAELTRLAESVNERALQI